MYQIGSGTGPHRLARALRAHLGDKQYGAIQMLHCKGRGRALLLLSVQLCAPSWLHGAQEDNDGLHWACGPASVSRPEYLIYRIWPASREATRGDAS